MYRVGDEDVTVNTVVKDETILLSQNAMVELFSVDKSSISRHLKNIFSEGELDEKVFFAKTANAVNPVISGLHNFFTKKLALTSY